MINILRKEDCCGCNACGDVCPKGAISFRGDEEGFLYPLVDTSICIQCGLCKKVCPLLNVNGMRDKADGREPNMYAAINRNLETRFDSTSGGVFSALAEWVFEKGGYVGGAVWGEGFVIQQVITGEESDLPKLRSSKYAQSDARGFYSAVKNAVATGRPVLVCGTPCQMVALRAVVGACHDNFTIVDFVCRGINSPLVMRRYVEMMERQQGSKVIAIKQKSKELGWHRLTTKFTFEDGSVKYDPKEMSYFMRGYLLSNAFCRPSCYECLFKGFPRLADITLADCWAAVEDLKGEFNDDLGTSLVFANTVYGEKVLSLIGDKILVEKVNVDKILLGNQALIKPLPKPSMPRKEFFERVLKEPFEQALAFARPSVHVGRKARIWRWLKSLFGDPLLTKIGHVVVDRENDAAFSVVGPVTIGASPYKRSSLESRILLRGGAVLILRGGEICYGCDIEVFKDARLEIGAEFYGNIGMEIICSQSISIGEGVIFGRHVTVRDTNGGHMLNSPCYRNSKPVVIGDHVWLCEGVKIMPGVQIGAGSVIAAGAVVTCDIPANSLAAGVPAKVIRKNVQWKR